MRELTATGGAGGTIGPGQGDVWLDGSFVVAIEEDSEGDGEAVGDDNVAINGGGGGC